MDANGNPIVPLSWLDNHPGLIWVFVAAGAWLAIVLAIVAYERIFPD